MSEDQISLIRSIVVDDTLKTVIIPDMPQPTLRSLGRVKSLNNNVNINSDEDDEDLTSDDNESDSEFDNDDFENDNGSINTI